MCLGMELDTGFKGICKYCNSIFVCYIFGQWQVGMIDRTVLSRLIFKGGGGGGHPLELW